MTTSEKQEYGEAYDSIVAIRAALDSVPHGDDFDKAVSLLEKGLIALENAAREAAVS